MGTPRQRCKNVRIQPPSSGLLCFCCITLSVNLIRGIFFSSLHDRFADKRFTISLILVKMSVIASPELGQRLSPSQLPIEEILPIEIIAHIFILCLPQDPLRHHQPALFKAPLLLCHVCSVWRSISLNTPQLWNNFHHKLRISRSSLSDPFWGILPSSLDFMEWWSKNIRGHSLSLRLALKWTKNSSDWPKNDPNRSVAFLFSMFSSVQFLEIEQSYALIVEQQLQPSPSQYPNLEFISILEDADDPIGTYSPQGISPWDVSACDFSFFRAPSLKRLVIGNLNFHPDSAPKAQVLFSPCGLTHLFVTLTLSLSTWSNFISGCANLEYARIHLKVLREDRAATTPTTRFILPKLRQLIIDCSSRQLKHVLDHLSFHLSITYTSSLRLHPLTHSHLIP